MEKTLSHTDNNPLDALAETERCLRKTGPQRHELTEPHLLYLRPDSAHAYTTAKQDSHDYADGFHRDIVNIMEKYSRQLLKRPQLALVDLGPGEYPDKTAPLIIAAHNAHIPIDYAPVDVSDFYLKQVSESVRRLAPEAKLHPFHSRFEDMEAGKLAAAGLEAPYIFLGPTYMNFSPDDSAGFFKKMMGPGSFSVVATELLSPSNTAERIRSTYDKDEFKVFGFGPLANLGCEQSHFEGSILFNPAQNRIEFSYLCIADDGPFAKDDTITTAISYRTTREGFESDLAGHFSRGEIFTSPSGHTALAVCGI